MEHREYTFYMLALWGNGWTVERTINLELKLSIDGENWLCVYEILAIHDNRW